MAHQCAENALALCDGGYLLQGELSKAQLARYQRVHGQLPGGPVTCRGHVGGRRAERDGGGRGEMTASCCLATSEEEEEREEAADEAGQGLKA